MSKKKNESAAGLLINTFGTILLLTVIIICTLNFIRDGRVYQILAEKAAANVSDAVGDDKTEPKADSDSAKSESSSKPAADKKPTADPDAKPTAKPANKPAATDSKNSSGDSKKPVQPGEEP